jgi:hypothetical protein
LFKKRPGKLRSGMMRQTYKGPERRKFVRVDFASQLAYKVCKKETVSKLLKGYTADISEAGLLCTIKEKMKKGDLLWLSFDRTTLGICEELEKRSLIYQNGVVGKVARIEKKKDGTFDVGIQFVTREEKNLTNIYPRIHFIKDLNHDIAEEEEGTDEEEGAQIEEEPMEELRNEKE